jgi:hypothetical protein
VDWDKVPRDITKQIVLSDILKHFNLNKQTNMVLKISSHPQGEKREKDREREMRNIRNIQKTNKKVHVSQ